MALKHPFPTGLHLVSMVLIVLAVFVAWKDPRGGILGAVGFGVAEMGMLGWAAFTFVHIANYERWGHFNPLFPLMFLAMLFAGVAAVFTSFQYGGLLTITSLAGGLIVAAGGGLAAYTIVEAMMQAKKEGDRKKQAAMEARRDARKARHSS